MNREIPSDDAAQLRTLCAIQPTEPLPDKLVNRYWKAKIVCDRMQWPVRAEFVRIAVECGFGEQTEREASPDVATLWRRKEIKAGQPVVVLWREKKIETTIVGLDVANQATVLIDGQERKVKVECVSLAA